MLRKNDKLTLKYLGGDYRMARKRKKKKGIRITHVFLLLIVLYISVVMSNQRKLAKNLDLKKKNLEDEISNLEYDIDTLNNELSDSDSLEFIEKIAREELGMVKPKEIIYIDKNKIKNSFFDDLIEDKD